MASSRRDFLRGLGCTFLTRAAVCAGAEQLLTVNAFAQAGSGYKALVCIFMFGGNDANNMIIPYDHYFDPGGYNDIRGGTGIQIPQADVLQIAPPSGGAAFGLHPALGNQFNGSSLFDLWNQNKVAAVVNVGPLIKPVSRTDYRSGLLHPYQLFSHSDQQTGWQTSVAQSPYPTGWAGRTADVFGIDPSGFPTIASISGVTIFSAGSTTRPIVLPDAGTTLANALKLKRASDGQAGSALTDLLAQDGSSGAPTLVRDVAAITGQAILNSQALQQGQDVTTVFPNTALGRQLKQVARLIHLAPTLGIARQIFFCSIGGFDTHNNQNPSSDPLNFNAGQPSLLNQLSQAMAAFYQCVSAELGVGSQVTTFTESDFSRTFKTGGSGTGTGTDHAWGSHQFVMGDAVTGGDFYFDPNPVDPLVTPGFPTLQLSGPNDTDDGSGARGRWIPTTGVDQYAATLATWFGVGASDLATVFPNIGNFGTSNLGFMSAASSPTNAARRVRITSRK
jgi:uncharacterized protein (DUF1501 family)